LGINCNFDDISKNPGVCFIALDPSQTKLQLFHHPSVIRGSWKNPNKSMIAFIDLECSANPVELVHKSINEVKGKSHSIHEFNLCCDSTEEFKKLRNPKTNFHFKNIMPIPSLLTKTFLELPSMEPDQVAIAFFETLYRFDIEVDFNNKNKASSIETESISEELVPIDQISSNNTERANETSNISDQEASQWFLKDCIHVHQFCHLCSIGKVTFVLFTSTNSSEAKAWWSSILSSANILELKNKNVSKHKVPEPSLEEKDGNSPVSKLSR
jgi:hypothetical protein